jgi:hypothetical protein
MYVSKDEPDHFQEKKNTNNVQDFRYLCQERSNPVSDPDLTIQKIYMYINPTGSISGSTSGTLKKIISVIRIHTNLQHKPNPVILFCNFCEEIPSTGTGTGIERSTLFYSKFVKFK